MAKKLVRSYIIKTKIYKNVKAYKSKGAFNMSTVLIDRTSNKVKSNHLKIIFRNSNPVHKYNTVNKESVDPCMEAWESLTEEEKDYADILTKRND